MTVLKLVKPKNYYFCRHKFCDKTHLQIQGNKQRLSCVGPGSKYPSACWEVCQTDGPLTNLATLFERHAHEYFILFKRKLLHIN